MIHKHLHTLFLAAVLSCLSVLAVAETPRLTVVIAVDGLQQQDLSLLRNFWPQGGMRTLAEEGFQTQVSLPFNVYGSSEVPATLFTGTTPNEHGVSFDKYFDRSTREVHSIFEDDDYKGIGTTLRVSPKALRTSTITDQFRLMAGPKAQIYALGLSLPTTLCMAGHSANACCWFDTKSERWATTSFYSEGLPSAADKQNTSGRIKEINQQEWTARMDIQSYMRPTDKEKKKPFSYTGLQGGKSPLMNVLMAELALAIQEEKKLGTDHTPDMLLLEMTVQSPLAEGDYIESAEQEEMYLSINQNIGYLQEQLNRRIGKDHYQILVVGLPRKGVSASALQNLGMPRREFSTDRAVALISTYLMALYGHERWVDGVYGQSVFLNKTLIEQRKLSLETIRRQVSEFMMEFEGIQGACPAGEVQYISANPVVDKLRTSLNKKTLGDVVFWLEENWVVIEKEGSPLDMVANKNPQIPILYWTGYRKGYPEKSQVSALNLFELLFN